MLTGFMAVGGFFVLGSIAQAGDSADPRYEAALEKALQEENAIWMSLTQSERAAVCYDPEDTGAGIMAGKSVQMSLSDMWSDIDSGEKVEGPREEYRTYGKQKVIDAGVEAYWTVVQEQCRG